MSVSIILHFSYTKLNSKLFVGIEAPIFSCAHLTSISTSSTCINMLNPNIAVTVSNHLLNENQNE